MESYLDWIKKVSADTDIVPLYYVADFRISPIDKIKYDDEVAVKLCNYVDVYKNAYITSDIEFMEGTATENEIERFTIKDGDVIITKDSESSDDIGIPAIVKGDFKELTVCGYHLALISPKKEKVIPKFLYYCFESKQHRLQIEIESTGVTRVGIPKDVISHYKIPLKSLAQQNKIVAYLDKEVDKIDSLIEKKNKLLKLLEEKKKATISQAVTKGLNPKAKMKPSGIDWLGDIPEHWEVTKFKYITSKIGSGVTPSGGAETYTDEGVLFLRSQNIYNENLKLDDRTYIPVEIHDKMKSSQLIKNDLLLNITGGSIGRCFYFDLNEEANINQHVCIIRCNEKAYYKYLHKFLISAFGRYQIDNLQYGGGREAISFENIKNFVIPIPSYEEQLDICNDMDNTLAEFNSVLYKTSYSIELLKEKRTAIISAAINGELNL